MAVGLDHEPLLAPEEVDEKAADAYVDFGLRQAVASNELEEDERKLA